MPKIRDEKREAIQRFVLENAILFGPKLVPLTTRHFGVSGALVYSILAELEQKGWLRPVGQTRSKRYEPVILREKSITLALSGRELGLGTGLDPQQIWEKEFQRELLEEDNEVRRTAIDLLRFCHNQLLLNAVEHAQGWTVRITLERSGYQCAILMKDDGRGIFANLKDHFKLANEQEALRELVKGGLSTLAEQSIVADGSMPKSKTGKQEISANQHWGKGIFYVLRIAEECSIVSHDLALRSLNMFEDRWIERQGQYVEGTLISVRVSPFSKRLLNKTIEKAGRGVGLGDGPLQHLEIPLSLFGDSSGRLLTADEAVAVLKRAESFSEIVFDFSSITKASPEFLRATFKLLSERYPAVKLTWINALPTIEQDIAIYLNSYGEDGRSIH